MDSFVPSRGVPGSTYYVALLVRSPFASDCTKYLVGRGKLYSRLTQIPRTPALGGDGGVRQKGGLRREIYQRMKGW